MVKLFKSLIFAILVFPFLISNGETNSPYWAGFESKQIPSNDGLSDFIITIKYSKDGKKYKITYLNESPHVEGTCEGEIYKKGKFILKVLFPFFLGNKLFVYKVIRNSACLFY